MKLNKNETFSLKNSYFLIYEFLEFMTHFITVVGIVLKSLNVGLENKKKIGSFLKVSNCLKKYSYHLFVSFLASADIKCNLEMFFLREILSK